MVKKRDQNIRLQNITTTMRRRFEQQQELDGTPIKEVKINMKTRHQLAPLLSSLQYIFITPELNEKIFTILEESIKGTGSQMGRPGMSLWEILVLGVLRLNLELDYDFLHDQANNHNEIRGILGVETRKVFYDGKFYSLQSIKDNVQLLTEPTLQKISAEVVKHGHQLKKKESEKEALELRLKTDGFAVESNIHFPTDINLLWDSIRKSLETIGVIDYRYGLEGWRKLKYLQRGLKKSYRIAAQIHQKKGKNYPYRIKKSVAEYLERSRYVEVKIVAILPQLLSLSVGDEVLESLVNDLSYYHGMLIKHIDLVERRIIKDEKIPHEEKVFSIFEPHVEWVYKGKLHRPVELGHNVIITTDQFQFIVDHKVLEKETEKEQVIPLGARLQENWGKINSLYSISFDKGFTTELGKQSLQKIFKEVILPKRGKKTGAQEVEEDRAIFINLRNKHSAVESNINELEHAGLDKVPDKKIDGFKRYVALGVLAYNLKRLGKIVLEQKLLSSTIDLAHHQKSSRVRAA